MIHCTKSFYSLQSRILFCESAANKPAPSKGYRSLPVHKPLLYSAPSKIKHNKNSSHILPITTNAVALFSKRTILLGLSVAAVGVVPNNLFKQHHVRPSFKHTSSSPAVSHSLPTKQPYSMNHSQDQLVDSLKAEGVVRHADVERALRAVDRSFFCDRTLAKHFKYMDHPLPIGYGETISAPHMHATCLELLRGHLKPGARVLDVGSGSGYLSVAMAEMVGERGKVIGIEKHPQLAQLSVRNVRAGAPHWLEKGVVELRAGNVLGNVLEDQEPFDAIHVGAAAEKLPEVLVRKLKPGGRMVIPVGSQFDYQVMECVDKDEDGRVRKEALMYVRYVPLTKPGETDVEE